MGKLRGNPIANMLGDLPSDLGESGPTPRPWSPGFDTTGTRRTAPGQAPPGGFQPQAGARLNFSSNPALAMYAPLISSLFDALYRRASFYPVVATASSAAALQLRPQEDRTYMLIQNNSAAVVYLGIGYAPTAGSGIQLAAGAVYEPFQVPQNEIYVLGSAASQSVVLLYANG